MRQFALRSSSLLTADIKHVDFAGVHASIEAWAAEVARRAEVERIIWYGSFISGTPTPRSDADLCVVVRDEAVAHVPRHSPGADYLPATNTAVPLDLAVLTVREYSNLATWAPAWERAMAQGRVLFVR